MATEYIAAFVGLVCAMLAILVVVVGSRLCGAQADQKHGHA